MKPRVVWVSFSPLEKTPRGWTSKMASVRYRLLVPAAALGGDYESKVIHLPAGANRRTLLERFAGAKAVIFGKLFGPFKEDPEQIPGLVDALRAQGAAVLADFSDDHFTDRVQGAAQCALANVVDRAVASTPGLAELMKDFTAAPISVVTDPVEGAQGEPRVPTAEPYRLLWFGHPTNVDTLQLALSQLRGLPVDLTLITAPGAGAEQFGRFRPWTAQGVFDGLRECDAVLIPSNPYDPRKVVKSPNRFTESIWAGRFVLAHPLPAYQELADYGWVGEDLGEGLRWFAAHRDEALDRIQRGQAAIAQRFSPHVVGAAWRDAIDRTIRR